MFVPFRSAIIGEHAACRDGEMLAVSLESRALEVMRGLEPALCLGVPPSSAFFESIKMAVYRYFTFQ
jgi:hypothetical protein